MTPDLGMIGTSPALEALRAAIRRVAPRVRRGLITGPTGSGKELVARALHACGPRASRRFVAVNCAAVVPTLIESELFGHARGAFTGAADAKAGLFEHADGGTLFLDEIGDLPLASQATLLRVLDRGEVRRVGAVEPRQVDVVVLAATNRDLVAEVQAGRFRADLYYRLAGVALRVPPLRDRRADVPDLAASFLTAGVCAIGPTALAALQAYDWPGNVRELRNVVERACLMADGPVVTEVEVEIPRAISAEHDTWLLASVEQAHLRRVLLCCAGDKTRAAALLGLSRRALYRRLEAHGMTDTIRRRGQAAVLAFRKVG